MKYSPLFVRVIFLASPSMRREWIEMKLSQYLTMRTWSPSMRREWIEIVVWKDIRSMIGVSLHAEGVD